MSHGLLRGSLIPDREQRELSRIRTILVREQADLMNRFHKLLEGANIKLGSVVTDIGGMSSMEMIEQLVAGNEDAAAMAGLARGRLKSKRQELEKALSDKVRSHHRFILGSLLRQLRFLGQEIAVLDREMEERMRPNRRQLVAIEMMDRVPGIGLRTAESMIAELWNGHEPLAKPSPLRILGQDLSGQ